MRDYALLKKVFQKHKFLNVTKAKPGQHQFVVVLDGLKPNFNIGKIFRSSDAFGASAVHLIKIPFFNVFPSRGSFKHIPAFFHDNFDQVYKALEPQGYQFYVMEPGEKNELYNDNLPDKSAFVLGHEEFGISFDRSQYPKIKTLSIPQFGKVQSLNVSVAASLVMYEYVRQRAKK